MNIIVQRSSSKMKFACELPWKNTPWFHKSSTISFRVELLIYERIRVDLGINFDLIELSRANFVTRTFCCEEVSTSRCDLKNKERYDYGTEIVNNGAKEGASISVRSRRRDDCRSRRVP